MFHIPPVRRLILPIFLCLALFVFYRLCHPSSLLRSSTHRAPASNTLPIFQTRLEDEADYRFEATFESFLHIHSEAWADNRATKHALDPLFRCRHQASAHTNHIRIPYIVQNVSQIPPGSSSTGLAKFNPTIMALPHWAENQYLLVSRVVTEGLHQENLMCEANVCHAGNGTRRLGESGCTEDDLSVLGPAGGLRCVEEPVLLRAPPTPAEQCDGEWENMALLPGFHDPRIFWSGRGEPLIIMNTQ